MDMEKTLEKVRTGTILISRTPESDCFVCESKQTQGTLVALREGTSGEVWLIPSEASESLEGMQMSLVVNNEELGAAGVRDFLKREYLLGYKILSGDWSELDSRIESACQK